MLPTRELVGAGVVTSAVGFGCAGLFQVPQRSDRRRVLDAAFDAGVQHFDVAPMYGLGVAETELAPFLRRHRAHVTVTTKFGIEPSKITKGIARVQRPMRTYLSKRTAINEQMKRSGKGPRSGSIGRLLYTSPGYNHRSAQLSLERSLRALGTDYIDVFLLHDPTGDLIAGAPSLVEYLQEQCQNGRIRCWGVSGERSHLASLLHRLGDVPVAQFRDDILEESLSDPPPSNGAWITYGALARALPLLRRFLATYPYAAQIWSHRLGIDVMEESSLPKLLLGHALRRNPEGPVLFSTSRPERSRIAAAAASESVKVPDILTSALSELAVAARRARTEMIQA
jgi:D-threo-aldose 1-dehydrogenase